VAKTLPIADLSTHPRPYVGIEALADYLEISPRTVYHHIERGLLQAVKIGGSLKIPLSAAQSYASGSHRGPGSNSNGTPP